MATATGIVNELVKKGFIPAEYRDDATKELHRELSRRSKRLVQTLAMMTSNYQISMRCPVLQAS